jgi:hypothetical protein
VEDAESCCRDANTRVGEPREITSKKASDSCSSWKEGRKEVRKTSSSTRRQTRRSARREWVLVLAGGRRRPQNRHPNEKKKKKIKKDSGGEEGRGGVGFSSKLAIFRENRFQ